MAAPPASAKLWAVDTLWFVLFFAVLLGLWWLAYRIDPHYSSKDGSRFLCHGQQITHGLPDGRRRETRVTVLGDGTLHVSTRRYAKRNDDRWALIGRSDQPPKKKQVFLARQFDANGWKDTQLALTIPETSRVIPVLERAMAQHSGPH